MIPASLYDPPDQPPPLAGDRAAPARRLGGARPSAGPRRPLVSAAAGQPRHRRAQHPAAAEDPPLPPYEAAGADRPPGLRSRGGRGGGRARPRAGGAARGAGGAGGALRPRDRPRLQRLLLLPDRLLALQAGGPAPLPRAARLLGRGGARRRDPRHAALRRPKLGIFDYMLRSFDPVHGDRDLVFIPVGINYDRVLEDRTLLLDLQPERERRDRLFAARTALRFLGRNLSLMLRSRWHRFGYACVNFGTPISMRAYLGERGLDLRRFSKEERTVHLERLGAELMERIGGVIPALPVPLVASVLVESAGEPLSELELKARTFRLMTELETAGAHVYIPRRDQDYAIVAGLRMLTLRHLVEEREGLYVAAPGEMTLLRYYGGSIMHLIPESVEFSRQMKVAERVMRENHTVLRALGASAPENPEPGSQKPQGHEEGG